MAKAVRIVWLDTKVMAELNAGVSRRLKAVVQFLANQVKLNISEPVVKKRVARKRTTVAGAAGTTYTVVVDETRSKPGEYPKAVTSTLLRDVFWAMESKLVGMVATSKKYGLILETLLNRSFLRRTVDENREQVNRVFLKRQPGDGPLFQVKG